MFRSPFVSHPEVFPTRPCIAKDCSRPAVLGEFRPGQFVAGLCAKHAKKAIKR